MKISIYCLCLILLYSCTNNHNSTNKIIAKIGDKEILYYNDVDKLMEQQIYDALYNIYYYRKISLNKILGEKVLLIEAKKIGITKEELEKKIYNKFIFKPFYGFCKKYYSLEDNRIQSIYSNFNKKEIKADEYQFILSYKDYARKAYVDSLFKINNVQILLTPPQKMVVDIDTVFKFSIGERKSKVKVYYLFNAECIVCKETFNNTIKRIVSEYKDKVCFSFVPFSLANNIEFKVLNAANNQDKFWDFMEFIMKDKNDKTNSNFKTFADSLGLNLDSYNYYIEKDTLLNHKIKYNYKYLSEKTFYGTPTIVVNNIIVDSFDYLVIKEAIDKKLEE